MSSYKRLVNSLKRLFKRPLAAETAIHPHSALQVEQPVNHQATRIPREQHNLSRSNISKNALRVLYRLKEAGYQAFLVGGGVRDMLLERQPKDFDVATNAHPEEVKNLFRNCRLIGRRFRLAHVHFGQEIIEVATFRASHDLHFGPDKDQESQDNQDRVIENGRLVRDNLYGTFEEDAWRRDFTINALYYNIQDFSVVDYTHGMQDLQDRKIRLIGDPLQRYQEDPVRMLRAIRFAAKLDFQIHPQTAAPITTLGSLLNTIPAARLYEEVLKLFMSGHALKSLELLREFQLFPQLFPDTERCLQQEASHLTLVQSALRSTDARIAEGKPVTPAFLFAALLWPPVWAAALRLQETEGLAAQDSLFEASHHISHQQQQQVAIPKRLSLSMREIWHMQLRLEKSTHSKRALSLISHPRFRAAYDFLALRAEGDAHIKPLFDWWTRLQQANPNERQELMAPPPPPVAVVAPSSAPKRRKRRPRKKASSIAAAVPASE